MWNEWRGSQIGVQRGAQNRKGEIDEQNFKKTS